MTQAMTELQREFHMAMLNIYEQAKRPPCNYHAGYFRRMVLEHAGVETDKRLLHAQDVQYGFTELWLCNRLELSVQYHVLQPRYRMLFTDMECTEASARLHAHGFLVNNDGYLQPVNTQS